MTAMNALYGISLCIMCASLTRCDITDKDVQNHQQTETNHDTNSTWSLWGDWSQSGSGNFCIYSRTRKCLSPNKDDCRGKNAELHPYNVSCKDTPKWSKWNPWICKRADNGDCTSFRERFCSSNNTDDCLGGQAYEVSNCNEDRCIGPIWRAWGKWSCSNHGDLCYMKRTRTCSTGMSGDCRYGLPWEIRVCDPVVCQVSTPHLSPWSEWTCTSTAGSCFQYRHRTCSTGIDDDCVGAKHEVVVCGKYCKDTTTTNTITTTSNAPNTSYTRKNPSTILFISTKTVSSTSSTSSTISSFSSTTSTPLPKATSSVLPTTITEATSERQYTTLLDASTDTSPSTSTRMFKIPTRPQTDTEQNSKLVSLIIPTKKYSQPEPGIASKLQTNSSQHTSVHDSHTDIKIQTAAWSEWYFSACSVTCGGGSKHGIRRCSSGTENDCHGSAFKVDHCNTFPCPVNGGWGSWQEWGSCSKSCGKGTRTRHRLCNDPQPEHGGASCVGASEETENCTVKECQHWGKYHEVGKCSVTCGLGVIQMKRDCSTGNDVDCTGSAYDEKPCELQNCQI